MKQNSITSTILLLIAIGVCCPFLFVLPVYFIGAHIVPILIVGIVLFLIIFIVIKYNKLVKYKNKIDQALGLVDIQLKMRFDLIPNLVNTVKGYAKHEKEVFTQTIKLRNKAASATDEKEKLQLANQLVPKVKDILMIAEDYPKLKSEALFKSLQEQLVDIEDRLVAARRIYDSNVNAYNTLIESFPSNLIAKLFKHKKAELFKIDANESLNHNIKF